MLYEVIDYIDKTGEKIIAFELTSGDLSGVVYSYGKVEFPYEDEPILSFEYTLHVGIVENLEAFRIIIGDILVEVIEDSVKNKNTIFYGGI